MYTKVHQLSADSYVCSTEENSFKLWYNQVSNMAQKENSQNPLIVIRDTMNRTVLCQQSTLGLQAILLCFQIMDNGPTMTWDDVAGLEFAKKTIKEIVVWPMLRP